MTDVSGDILTGVIFRGKRTVVVHYGVTMETGNGRSLVGFTAVNRRRSELP